MRSDVSRSEEAMEAAAVGVNIDRRLVGVIHAAGIQVYKFAFLYSEIKLHEDLWYTAKSKLKWYIFYAR